MSKSQTRKLAKKLTGTARDGGIVNGVWTDQTGQVWIGITKKGAGFLGSTLKTAVKYVSGS